MIPLKISESPRRPIRSLVDWPRMPDQFVFIAAHSAVLFTMPGVHSTVWIFAISAELMSHAFSKSCWSDRKSTRLNSSHANISYAVFCLKKKKKSRPHPLSPCWAHKTVESKSELQSSQSPSCLLMLQKHSTTPCTHFTVSEATILPIHTS